MIAYGTSEQVAADAGAAFVFPWFSYEKTGLWLARNIWAIPFYNIPLVVAAYAIVLVKRPRIIMANGLLLGAALAPLAKFTTCQVVVAYHSYSSHFPAVLRRVLGKLLGSVSVAFVNSAGSEVDLATVMESGKIRRVEHWAHETYFRRGAARSIGGGRAPGELRVLYVGRLDDEKVRFLLDVIALCADDPIAFTLVGDGPLAGVVRTLASKGVLVYERYIVDRSELATHYVACDVLWGMADMTYVAKPVSEALACGASAVIPDRPAVDGVARGNARIARDLLPPPVGFIVDGDDPLSARAVLLELQKADRTAWPAACRSYAEQRYSAGNAGPVIELLRNAQ